MSIVFDRGPIEWPIQVGETGPETFDLSFTEIDEKRYIVGVLGDLDDQPVPLRIESACVFGHIFRGVQCDCGDQFEMALEEIIEREHGIVVFGLDDDARGHGVDMHFKLYELRQHHGRTDERELFDEWDLELDARDYTPIVEILLALDVRSVRLMTNNPERMQVLEENGIDVVERIPVEVEVTEYNETLLLQEKEWMGYTTSYHTHDEWIDTFRTRQSQHAHDYGYIITADHTSIEQVAFGDSEISVTVDGLDADESYLTLYANVSVPDEVREKVDKVVTVHDDQSRDDSERPGSAEALT